MEVILSASSKGGVGKSEIAKLTAYQLKRDDYDVAMMDADIDSSNLATRMDAEGRVDHTDDDKIKPIVKDGIKIYSMESAFADSSFSQSGKFMRTVIRSMVRGTEWEDPDYLIVDCPPGTKDIFDELVKVLRDDLLGAIVIGQSDSIDDVGRMVKVCDYNYVPIIGFVENMSGVYMDGELVTSNKSGQHVAPFGKGKIEKLADTLDGKFLGSIPLCNDTREIEEAAKNTIKRISIAIKDGNQPQYPDLNEGDKGFYKNVLQSLKSAIQTVNSSLDVNRLQEQFGNPDNPKIISIKLTDAQGKWMLPSKIHLKIDNGLSPVRNPDEVYGGVEISSQELKFALEGKRLVMDSTSSLYEDEYMDQDPYGLVKAVQLGKADIWGKDVVNYLSLLDKIFEEVLEDAPLRKS